MDQHNSDQVAFFNYTFDDSNNIIATTNTEGLTEYDYNSLNQLVEARYPDGNWEHFTLDVAGNRKKHEDQNGSTTYTYDIGDRLLSTTGTKPSTCTWDLNGNMIEKETPDGITSYSWNVRNKLAQVMLPNGDTNQYSYYPGSSLRYSIQTADLHTQKFVYEGSNVIEELDNWLTTTTDYINGLGIDKHVAKVFNGNTYAYITDHLGTVHNIVDSSGEAVNSYSYTAYGETRQKEESIDNPYLYTGRRLDTDTMDYYYRARYYIPDIGRFSSADSSL